MTIGQRIKTRREELGISVDEIARRLGKHRATIYRYESSEIGTLPTSVLEPLSVILETTPAYLMGWEDAEPPATPRPSNVQPMPPVYQVPRLGTIACGDPLLAEQNIEAYDAIPDYVQCDFTLLCKGDSMINARIFDGDIVCIRRQPEVENGEIAAVLIDSEEATLKRVKRYDDRLILEPENPMYKPLVFWGEEMNDVRILGKATHFISAVK